MTAAAKKSPTIQRDLEKEMGVAAALKEQIKAVLGEENADAITLRDMIEGSTDLLEIIDQVALQIGEDDSRAEGIGALQKTLASRKERLTQRSELLRAMLCNALDIIGERKLERPIATISLRPILPKLIITDEAAVPSTYWKEPDPVLARKELGDALKARKEALEFINAEKDAGRIDAGTAELLRGKVDTDHPIIPGAELDNGGTTIQLRFG